MYLPLFRVKLLLSKSKFHGISQAGRTCILLTARSVEMEQVVQRKRSGLVNKWTQVGKKYFPRKTLQIIFPGQVTPAFCKWESCWMIPPVGKFSQGSPISPILSFRCCSIFTSLTLIGSQGLDEDGASKIVKRTSSADPGTERTPVKRRKKRSSSMDDDCMRHREGSPMANHSPSRRPPAVNLLDRPTNIPCLNSGHGYRRLGVDWPHWFVLAVSGLFMALQGNIHVEKMMVQYFKVLEGKPANGLLDPDQYDYLQILWKFYKAINIVQRQVTYGAPAVALLATQTFHLSAEDEKSKFLMLQMLLSNPGLVGTSDEELCPWASWGWMMWSACELGPSQFTFHGLHVLA
ncbi:hypothetical protein PR048_000575 [Dryococelus australis]|uniref:Uncharacterized protein n=1 Tax=Dryococelus australis TaxID=614101 RepID=A0ABQ9IF07_9NEOP|nr:hypothetical protein PR048_000575 [Dryococelus australis]